MTTDLCVSIQLDGTVLLLDPTDRAVQRLRLEATSTPQRHRASHIEPEQPLKRAAFRLIRRLGSDTGLAAAWTRTWRGPWRVRLAATNEIVAHDINERSEAIRKEQTVLQARWFGTSTR